ncbi:MAG: phosphatidate cytidylyltransferase [Mycoplasmatales bacterium]
MKRWIGGTVFSVLSIFSILLGFFEYLCVLFIIIGLYEVFKMGKIKNSLYLYFYMVLYILGVISMFLIYQIEPLFIAILVGGIMLNDSFAYFTGKAIGRTPFSKISPNKTVEGIIGGIFFGIIIICGLVMWFMPFLVQFFPIIEVDGFSVSINLIIALVIAFSFGTLGDLAESKLKRITGVKDSGTIVYGHGGILDRIDSWVVASIPIFLLLLIFN